jgi:acetylornithine deacetylase/succinyl-diaminopimelate desuccinylase-like protein
VTGATPSIIPIAPPTLPIIAPLQRLVGVPGLAAPDNPIYSGCRAHAPNEHIRLSDVQPAIRFTYALLQDLATAR